MEDPAPKPALRVHEDGIASPSAQIIADANAPETLDYEDAQGRAHKLVVTRRPGVLGPLRLTEAVGADNAVNPAYMQMVRPLIYLQAIDAEPVFAPKTKLEIEALIQRLDEEGMGALSMWWTINFLVPAAKMMADADEEAAKAAVKN